MVIEVLGGSLIGHSTRSYFFSSPLVVGSYIIVIFPFSGKMVSVLLRPSQIMTYFRPSLSGRTGGHGKRL